MCKSTSSSIYCHDKSDDRSLASMKSAVGTSQSFPSNHDIQPAVGASRQQHLNFRRQAIKSGSWRVRCEYRFIFIELHIADRRNAGQELDSIAFEPAQHLIHRMLALVWLPVLVRERSRPASCIKPRPAQPAIKHGHPIPKYLDQPSSPQSGQATEPVVETNQDVAARLELGEDRPEATFWIGRMVEHAV